MTKSRHEFVEFSLYDEILNGRLRPFLVKSFSNQVIAKILDELASEKTADNFENSADGYFADDWYEIPDSDSLDKSSSEEEFYLSVKEPFKTYNRPAQSLNPEIESKEAGRGRPGKGIRTSANNKAEQLEVLIQNEFECIKQRALNLKRFSSNEDELKVVANRNIGKAKKLALVASGLGGQVINEDSKLDDHNAYIIDMLRCFLVRSIIFYQHHFSPYIDQQLISDDELKDLLGQGEVFWHIIKRLEEGQVYGTGERTETSSPCSVQNYSDVNKNGNRFGLKGDFWEVSFGGNETTIRNLERIKYIVRLLESPNKDFYCHELALLVKGENPDTCFPDPREIDPIESDDHAYARQDKINVVDPTEDEISREDLAACKNIANGLWQAANDPNMREEERANAKKDWKKASDHFSNEYGLFFYESKTGGLRPKIMKRLKSDFERSRINVKKQISKAISDIAEKNPSFSAYLENHIRTGIKCAFRPDPEDKCWTIEWGL
jgi:hypothetical protein